MVLDTADKKPPEAARSQQAEAEQIRPARIVHLNDFTVRIQLIRGGAEGDVFQEDVLTYAHLDNALTVFRRAQDAQQEARAKSVDTLLTRAKRERVKKSP